MSETGMFHTSKASRGGSIFALVAVLFAVASTRWLVQAPNFTDAYYHYNAAQRLVAGYGLTDPYLWMYIGAPETLSAGESVPSHTYWMPFTSLSAAAGMWLLNAPGVYWAAQLPFTLMYALTAGVGYFLGIKLGGTARHGWTAGLLTLFSGFFLRWWGTIDTFAPYALFGSLCLLAIGLGLERGSTRWFVAAGVLGALCHLTRADGLLMLLVGWAVVLWLNRWSKHITPPTMRQRVIWIGAMTFSYLLVMLPWFVRSVIVTGSPLPLGGTQTIWFTEYNDLFSFPPDASPQSFFAQGLSMLFESRWTALTSNVGTLLAVEGMIFVTPLMFIGLWMLRRQPFVRGFWLYALGVHLVMTLVFPFPGYRGGLFHSSAALLPWWMALGTVGLDRAVDRVARKLPHWNPPAAKQRFSALMILVALVFGAALSLNRRALAETPTLYRLLSETLPDDARVMSSNPAELYYYTGLAGVVLPNEAPETILIVAAHYQITHVLVQNVTIEADGTVSADVPTGLLPIVETPPTYLQPLDFASATARVYAIITR